MDTHYWFKPYRFWKWCAAYYPVAWQGWIVLMVASGVLLTGFLWSHKGSPSASDTLLHFIPIALAVLTLFDVITRVKGEYPWWWSK